MQLLQVVSVFVRSGVQSHVMSECALDVVAARRERIT